MGAAAGTTPRTTRQTGAAKKIRALSVRYPELGPSALAKVVGCTPQTVSDVLKRFLGHRTEQELRDFQQNKPDVLDAIGQRCLGSITESKLRKASATSLVTAYAILEDKSRLIRGMPTGLDVHVLLDLMSVVRGDRK